ncbi:hypothetical protein [Acidithiobacillus ferrooxidans]|uniref:hypothetical protein n=1 Tax=Acidithiobacillus ferrooxidans TaxID=920 RepID=UPI001D038B72|nr:hypothetical protein [Acidithiobacillus ferrooxidans]
MAGGVDLGLALLLGEHLPALPDVTAALLLGFFAYGASASPFSWSACAISAVRGPERIFPARPLSVLYSA